MKLHEPYVEFTKKKRAGKSRMTPSSRPFLTIQALYPQHPERDTQSYLATSQSYTEGCIGSFQTRIKIDTIQYSNDISLQPRLSFIGR